MQTKTMTNDKAHRTAIKRVKPSTPMVYLNAYDRLSGRVLDFGCGKGFDVNYYGLVGYDPYHYPTIPEGQFDTITCNYVLNVISEEEQEKVFDQITQLLNNDYSVAYFSVRRDKFTHGFNKRGTFQRMVKLESPFTLLTDGSRCAIYMVTKKDLMERRKKSA